MRPMATITHDTPDWYGFDADDSGVYDVIGTRCDPYTNRLLNGSNYHRCCHSNLTRALASEAGLSLQQAEAHVHDMLNIFKCTGFTHDTHQYFMKASPVRPGGDCGAEHSRDTANCYPLKIEFYHPDLKALAGWSPPEPSAYSLSQRG